MKSVAFNLYICGNMLVCATVFAPWALPRETVSGLMGRWISTEPGLRRSFAVSAAWLIDRIYFWEANHCIEVYKVEKQARDILYP